MTEYLDIDLGKDDPDCRISIEINEKGTHFYMDMGGGTIKPETEMKIFMALGCKLLDEGRISTEDNESDWPPSVDTRGRYERRINHDCEEVMNFSGICDVCGKRVR